VPTCSCDRSATDCSSGTLRRSGGKRAGAGQSGGSRGEVAGWRVVLLTM
jgi:hypothetical protein